MSTFEEVFMGGLLEPALFAVATVALLWLADKVATRLSFARRILPLRRWELQRAAPFIRRAGLIVGYALVQPQGSRFPYYMVEEGDVRCLYLMYSLLGRLYGASQVTAVAESRLEFDTQMPRNVVLLSGPLWNDAMQVYAGAMGSPVRVVWDQHDLKIVANGGEEFCSTYVGDHRIRECHGILVGGDLNVGEKHQHVLIVAGCSNLSTYAGAALLSRLSSDRALRRQIRGTKIQRCKRWALCYKVENLLEPAEDTPHMPTIQSGALRVSVVQGWTAAAFGEAYEYRLGRAPAGTVR